MFLKLPVLLDLLSDVGRVSRHRPCVPMTRPSGHIATCLLGGLAAGGCRSMYRPARLAALTKMTVKLSGWRERR